MSFNEKLELAQQGNINAMGDVARAYADGIDVEKNAKECFDWAVKTAEKAGDEVFIEGDIYAFIADAYFDGVVVEKDIEKGFYWLKKGANTYDMELMERVGDCYNEGYGVKQDKGEALEWYLHSANEGRFFAMHKVGLAYLHGIGVEARQKIAHEYFTRAASCDYEPSKKILEEVEFVFEDEDK